MSTLTAPGAGLMFTKARGIRKLKNNVATVLVTAAFGVALIPLVWLLWTVITKGYHAVFASDWWTKDQSGVAFNEKGGGALAAIIGTAEQVALCTVISVPIGILVGIYLVEYGRGAFARVTTFMVDIMTGIPSIVAALFIYALFVTTLGGQLSGALVSFALVILMLPVIVRTTEEMLRLVPNELREASYALGVPKWRTVVKVVIPTALSGLITGVVLGIARVAGETAPLLILVGYASGTENDPFAKSQAALPTLIRDQFRNINTASGPATYHLDAQGNRVAGAVANYAPERMWGAALTLIIIVMALNLIARLIGRRVKTSS
jgi:phosphate transport system permease protein